jgi:hypothetical protein
VGFKQLIVCERWILPLRKVLYNGKSRSFWGQMAVVCFPIFLFSGSSILFVAHHETAVRISAVVFAVFILGCFIFAIFMYVRLRRPMETSQLYFNKSIMVVVLIYAAILLPDIGVFPIWDAGLYFHALSDGVQGYDLSARSFIYSFLQYKHPTQGYSLLMAPGQFIAPGSTLAANITTLILGVIMLLAFYRFSQKLFGDVGMMAECATLIFALMPTILAFTTGVNPDFAMLFGTCVVLYSFAADQKLLQIFSGFVLVFSKEPGVVLYGGFLIGVFLFAFLPGIEKGNVWFTLAKQLKHYGALLVPLIGFCVYLGYFGWSRVSSASALTRGGFGSFQWNSVHVGTALLQVFVLNFNWIHVVLIVLAVLLFRKRIAVKNVILLRVSFMSIGIYFLFLLLYFEIDLLRYVLPLMIFFPIALTMGLFAIFNKLFLRYLSFVAICLLLSISSFAIIDPISKNVFPLKYDVGSTKPINITNSAAFYVMCDTGICNRQYLAYSKLIDEIFADNGMDENRPYVSINRPSFAFQFFGNGDIYKTYYSGSKKRRMILSDDGVVVPGLELMVSGIEDVSILPTRFLWLAPPDQATSDFDLIQSQYGFASMKSYSKGAFTMDVYECIRF